jgi:hypothetical protein
MAFLCRYGAQTKVWGADGAVLLAFPARALP